MTALSPARGCRPQGPLRRGARPPWKSRPLGGRKPGLGGSPGASAPSPLASIPSPSPAGPGARCHPLPLDQRCHFYPHCSKRNKGSPSLPLRVSSRGSQHGSRGPQQGPRGPGLLTCLTWSHIPRSTLLHPVGPSNSELSNTNPPVIEGSR